MSDIRCECNGCPIKEKYLDADAYNEGLADGRAVVIEVLNKINEEVDIWWCDLKQENSKDDANWYTSIKMLLEQLKEKYEKL